MRLDQVTVGSTDLGRSEAFYRALGLEFIVKDDHYLRFACPVGDSTFSVELVGAVPDDEQVVVYFESDDVDGDYRRLRSGGIEFEQPPTDMPWLWRESRLRDPDGHRLCVSSTGARTGSIRPGGCPPRPTPRTRASRTRSVHDHRESATSTRQGATTCWRAVFAWCRSTPRRAPSGCGPSASATTRTRACCSCTEARGPRTSTSRLPTPTCPPPGIEYYYYDQLGSAYSDQPDEPSLWEIDRFVDEVEQVRIALGLDQPATSSCSATPGVASSPSSTRCATRNISRGSSISNMMSSIPAYNAYAEQVLMPAHGPGRPGRDQGDRIERRDRRPPLRWSCSWQHHYVHHVLRMPVDEWPDPVTRAFAHINQVDLRPAAGAERTGSERQARRLGSHRRPRRHRRPHARHRRRARHDESRRSWPTWRRRFPRGRYLHCPHGSHMAMYDDQSVYFEGLVRFLLEPDG